MPDADFYGDFLLLENGVGLWALLKSEVIDALKSFDNKLVNRHISIATGVAAYPLLCELAALCEKKFSGLKCDVYAIKNDFFGEKITVAGLVTATDIYNQLKDKNLGDVLLIPSSMLRAEGDMFLDSITVSDIAQKLNVEITVTNTDGYSFVESILGTKEEY